MTVMVTGVGLLDPHLQLGYMHDDPGYARFLTYLNLFMASMLILVLGSNMPLMFVGWEGVGLCSYLLIGFWFENGDYAAAGRKAFVVNRIGDFGVLLGMFLLVSRSPTRAPATPSSSTTSTGATRLEPHRRSSSARVALGSSVATVAAPLPLPRLHRQERADPALRLAPRRDGRPHAGLRAHPRGHHGHRGRLPLLSPRARSSWSRPIAMAVIAIVGALTALLAATIALVQNQMKKILAYSTVSQLGFMFAAVGCGAFAGGFFHVFTHAFFKACLFLGAGSVMHAVHAHGDADIRYLGGLRRTSSPTPTGPSIASCLAIAGLPLFSGFFSKDEILLGALELGAREFREQQLGRLARLRDPRGRGDDDRLLHVPALLHRFPRHLPQREGGTGGGRRRRRGEGLLDPAPGHEEEHGYDPHPHRPGMAIAGVLSALGVGAIAAGLINLEPLLHLVGVHELGGVEGGNFWGTWLSHTIAHFDADIGGLSYLAAAGGVGAMATGIGLAWFWYLKEGRMPMAQPSGISKWMMNKWYVDELYEATVIRATRGLAIFAAAIDKYFVDGILARATALGVSLLGWLSTRIQNGVVYTYGAVMVLGMAVLAWWFVYPHPSLEGTATRTDVTWTSGQGLGYEYRWDVDDDGEMDTEWSASENSVSYTYGEDKWRGFALLMDGDRPGELEEVALDPDGDEVSFDEEQMGRGWEADPEAGSSLLPTFRVAQDDEGGIIFRKNDARARVRGGEATEEERLHPGDIVQVGSLNIRVGAVVAASIEVRNTFGNVAHETQEIVIQPAGGPPAEVAALQGGAP